VDEIAEGAVIKESSDAYPVDAMRKTSLTYGVSDVAHAPMTAWENVYADGLWIELKMNDHKHIRSFIFTF